MCSVWKTSLTFETFGQLMTILTISLICAVAGLMGTGLTLIDSIRDMRSLSRRAARIAPQRIDALRLVAIQAFRHEVVRLLVQALILTAAVNAVSDTVLKLMSACSLAILVSSVWDYSDRRRLARRLAPRA